MTMQPVALFSDCRGLISMGPCAAMVAALVAVAPFLDYDLRDATANLDSKDQLNSTLPLLERSR